MSTIKAYAAHEAKAKLQPYEFKSQNIGETEVEIKVSHCGICHSDIHLIDNDWGISSYPLVPGHEVIGIISSTGSKVKNLKIGDRVGLGWQSSSCGNCEWCIKGDENFCAQQGATCVGRFGGYAEKVIADEKFVFLIPQGLESQNAAPLLCGGITVYSPLREYQIKPNDRVGIVGIGGLGHLAIQFANKMGCEVAAFSSSDNKTEEAKKLGAHHVINSSQESEIAKWTAKFDFILVTATADLNWNLFLECLRPKGKLCFVGVPPSMVQVHAFSLIGGSKSICGSPIGSRTRIEEMLQFSARHQITAKTEALPFDKVNEAIDRVRQNKARYRMVLTF